MKRTVVVAGIGTEVGKTLVSAILVEALDADFWKPVQSGATENSDSRTVRELAPGSGRRCHREAYLLDAPLSPHSAARLEGITIERERLVLPETGRNLIVELAGGLMVPLNDRLLNIDLLADWRLPVILVSTYYLGSINHTLLSVAALRERNIPILGLVLNGSPNRDSRAAKLDFTGLPCLLELPRETRFGPDETRRHAARIDLEPLFRLPGGSA